MKDTVAIVTGAAGGIGEAIVRRLGADGVRVIGTGRNEAKLAALKAALDGVMAFDYIAADITAAVLLAPVAPGPLGLPRIGLR